MRQIFHIAAAILALGVAGAAHAQLPPGTPVPGAPAGAVGETPPARPMATAAELAFQRAEANFKAKNYQDAYLQLLPIAHAGEPRAQYILAQMSDNGAGPVQIDPAEAARWYSLAAAQNFPEAQYALANAYATGRGVPVDGKVSVQWLMRAAGNNYSPAMMALSNLYQAGLGGLEKNVPLAASWVVKAAEAGSVDALYFYGRRLELGDGAPKDEKLAMLWYKRAAQRGQAAAQYRLGSIGDGTRTSPDGNVDAYMWLTLASQRAKDKVRTDAQQAIRAMTPNMMPSEVTEASTRARAWRPEPPPLNIKPDPAYDGQGGLNAPPPGAAAAGG